MAEATINILGVKIDRLDRAAATQASQEAMRHGPARYIVLPHVEFLTRARQDSTARTALNQAWLALPNGVALGWAAAYGSAARHGWFRLLKSLMNIVTHPESTRSVLPDRFDSTNFTWPLLEFAARERLRVALIGRPKGGQIKDTVAYLQSALPGLEVSGFDGYQANDYAAAQQFLVSTKADLILVGMGFPRQELLMQRATAELPHGLLIGEGGSFDYEQFGGRIRRAPAWMQHHGLEWLWRLLREPSRLKRQLAVPQFIWLVYRSVR